MDPPGPQYFMSALNAPGGSENSATHVLRWPIDFISGSMHASPHQCPNSTGHYHSQAMEKNARQAVPLLT